MKKTEKMKLYSERNSLYDEINERFQRIMEIDKSITADEEDNGLKIEYAGKAVKITKNSVTDKTIEIVMYVDKCVYSNRYVALTGKYINMSDDDGDMIVMIRDDFEYDSILDGDDDETITILSDKEYEEFYNEACKSITEKLKK